MGAGLDARFWIWRDEGGLHLRWTADGEARRFSGTVSAPGRSLEARPAPGAEGAGVRIERPDGSSVRFSARTAGSLSGLDVPDASGTVAFDLALDDIPCPLHVVRLGAGEVRPRHAPVVFDPGPPAPSGLDHHDHAHLHPHPPGLHHHHPHPHPHPPGLGHHHPW